MNSKNLSPLEGIVGILPTPATADASSPNATNTVNEEVTVAMVERIAASGVDNVLTNGTFGEVATLTLDELLRFNELVVASAAGRTRVFAGASALNTRDVIERSRALRDLNVDGLFLGRPMWLPLDDRQIVEFYRAVAAAVPDLPIVAYDNPGVFKGKISPSAFAGLATIPQIVAVKHVGHQPGSDWYANDLAAVGGAFPLLPTIDTWYSTAEAFPGQVPAAWCGDVACGPSPALALRDAIRTGDTQRAKAVHDDIVWASETLFPDGDITKFMPYSIQIDRAEFNAAGLFNIGPTRPPYTSAPEAYLEGGAEVGRRWATLEAKYAKQLTGAGA